MLNYKDTDLSHLTSIDYKAAINQVNYATLDLVKRIHFNPNKPENINTSEQIINHNLEKGLPANFEYDIIKWDHIKYTYVVKNS